MRSAKFGIALAVIPVIGLSAKDRPLTGSEFQAIVDGRTVHYTRDGAHYGSEQFLGEGRAIWQYPDGECLDGFWREVEQQLCFFYASLSCWEVSRTAEGGYSAISESGIVVDVHSITDEPLSCGGIALS